MHMHMLPHTSIHALIHKHAHMCRHLHTCVCIHVYTHTCSQTQPSLSLHFWQTFLCPPSYLPGPMAALQSAREIGERASSASLQAHPQKSLALGLTLPYFSFDHLYCFTSAIRVEVPIGQNQGTAWMVLCHHIASWATGPIVASFTATFGT